MNLGVRLSSCVWSRFSCTCRLGAIGKSSWARYASPLVTRSSLLARNYATAEPGRVIYILTAVFTVYLVSICNVCFAWDMVFEFWGSYVNNIILINAHDIVQKQDTGLVSHTSGCQWQTIRLLLV